VAEIAAIKQGADFSDKKGTVVTNRELTLDPHKPSSYAFCSDTIYTEDFVAQIKGVEMLYHEATFKKEHTARAAETFHSTTIQAATIAQKAGVGHLIVGHYSARYDDLNLLLEECKSVFENSELAIEGKVYHF
jgi:ribonuclease Z